MGKVIAVCNEKGGVGKTTTTLNLGACLARYGASVLLIDSDQQGNLTQGCGYPDTDVFETTLSEIYQAETNGADPNEIKALFDSAIGSIVYRENTEDEYFFDLLPGNRRLAGVDKEVESFIDPYGLLRSVMEKAKLKKEYQYILIDCPPALGTLTLNALIAADEVLIPVNCGTYAAHALGDLYKTVQAIKTRMNPKIKINGIVFTMKTSGTISSELIADIDQYYENEYKYETTIRDAKTSIESATAMGLPLLEYAKTLPPSKEPRVVADYMSLALEFVEHMK